MQLSLKDCELEEVRSELESRKAAAGKNSPSAVIEGLKKELQAVIDRNKTGKDLIKYLIRLLYVISLKGKMMYTRRLPCW